MGEKNIFGKAKELIGSIGFCVFLWSMNLTEEQYLDYIHDGCVKESE
jgi:hypothetical protein